MQQLEVEYGLASEEFEINADRLITSQRVLPPTLEDPVDEIRSALETPSGFPALRKALTEDDHITLVVDERLPMVADLLTPIVEHIQSAGVAVDAITLLCPPTQSQQQWLDELPDELDDLRVEVHNPTDEKRLSYLATTKGGRRIYLNRTLVEADQIVALTARRFDPLLGRDGGEGAFFPAMGNPETRGVPKGYLHFDPPQAEVWQSRSEAKEITWLLGSPFFVQIVEGMGDSIAHVLAGVSDTCEQGDRLLDHCWKQTLTTSPDLVLATLRGDPEQHTFTDFAMALFNASRVVGHHGHIVLLTEAKPTLIPSLESIYHVEDPSEVLRDFEQGTELDQLAIWLWCQAASQAHLYIASGLSDEVVEDLFATPLQRPSQAQRLLESANRVLILEDAHKALPILEQ